jgi:hypothetical protein
MTAWHEILPAIGDFINKTGFPIALWVIAGFAFYKVFQKFFRKLEPIIDAHFELVTELKNTSGRTADILEKQNNILSTELGKQNILMQEHSNILNDHSDKLETILKSNIQRNELLEDKMMTTTSSNTNGIKR